MSSRPGSRTAQGSRLPLEIVRRHDFEAQSKPAASGTPASSTSTSGRTHPPGLPGPGHGRLVGLSHPPEARAQCGHDHRLREGEARGPPRYPRGLAALGHLSGLSRCGGWADPKLASSTINGGGVGFPEPRWPRQRPSRTSSTKRHLPSPHPWISVDERHLGSPSPISCWRTKSIAGVPSRSGRRT